jgi:hypothetical protein
MVSRPEGCAVHCTPHSACCQFREQLMCFAELDMERRLIVIIVIIVFLEDK